MKVRINIMSIAFCVYMAAVAVLCFMKSDSMPDMSGTWFGFPKDKVAHFLMFLPFTPLSYLTFRSGNSSFWTKIMMLTLMLTIGAGLAYSTEMIQEKLNYRSYETKDLMFDGIGLAVGYAVIATRLIIKKITLK
jgi:glycopeptide antibiotics resistance protein